MLGMSRRSVSNTTKQVMGYRKSTASTLAGFVFLIMTTVLVGVHIGHMTHGELVPSVSETVMILGFGLISAGLITGEGLGGVGKVVKAWRE